MTKKINNVNPVHINFWLKGTLVSGAATSGRRGVKGLIRSRNRSPLMVAIDLSCHQNNNEVEKRKVKMKLEL